MASPFIGEIRIFGGNFAPAGWAFCDGAQQAIAENDALFNLIGTTYGGDGVETFNLPDLRGRVPIHVGSGVILSQTGGVETVVLTGSQMPQHTHALQVLGNSSGTQPTPGGNLPAQSFAVTPFTETTASTPLNANAITPASGGSQPHDNFQPYLCVNFIISLFGIFPTQS
jgi:microcystin-dependent protein